MAKNQDVFAINRHLQTFRDADRLYSDHGAKITVAAGPHPLHVSRWKSVAQAFLATQEVQDVAELLSTATDGVQQAFRFRCSATHRDAIACFRRLAEQAAGLLDEEDIAALGIAEPYTPIGLWLGALMVYCRATHNPFWTDRTDGGVLRSPFAASARMIDAIREHTDSQEAELPIQNIRGKPLDKNALGQRAWQILQGQPDMTIRDFAAELGVSTGTAGKLPAWKQHAKAKKNRQTSKGRKAINFSDKLEASVGMSDDPLDKLIAEQDADHEPSPLANTGRGPRIRKTI